MKSQGKKWVKTTKKKRKGRLDEKKTVFLMRFDRGLAAGGQEEYRPKKSHQGKIDKGQSARGRERSVQSLWGVVRQDPFYKEELGTNNRNSGF